MSLSEVHYRPGNSWLSLRGWRLVHTPVSPARHIRQCPVRSTSHRDTEPGIGRSRVQVPSALRSSPRCNLTLLGGYSWALREDGRISTTTSITSEDSIPTARPSGSRWLAGRDRAAPNCRVVAPVEPLATTSIDVAYFALHRLLPRCGAQASPATSGSLARSGSEVVVASCRLTRLKIPQCR